MALLSPVFVIIIAMAQVPSPSDALALEQQGRFAEAASAWRAVTERDPRDAAAYASLGVVLSKEHKYTEAAQAYKRALALNPKLPGIQFNLGLASQRRRLPIRKAPRRALCSV